MASPHENPIIRLQRQVDRLEMEKVHLRKRVTELEGVVEEYELAFRKAGGSISADMRQQMHNHIGLTPKELEVLFLLFSRPEGMTKGAIMDTLYAYGHADAEIPDQKIVDVYVCKLRKKLREKTDLPHDVIQTIFGKGYRIATHRRRAALDEFGLEEWH